MEAHPPLAHRGVRGLGELVHAHEPLQRDQRLDAVARAVAVAHLVLVGLLVAQQALGEQRVAHPPARLVDGEAGKLARDVCHAPVVADRRELGQAVAAADLEVVRIVPGGDLERAGAEVHLHVLIGDDRHLAVDERHDGGAPDQVRIALVVGVHRDGGVGQDRLGPHRGDHQVLVARLDPVAHLEQGVDGVLVAHLEVGDRGRARRAPVDQAVVAVDVALAVQAHEHLEHGAHVALVHGEALVLVVERASQPFELLDDRGSGRRPPLPHALDEALAAEVETRLALGAQLLLDHRVDGDRGVVGAADPERVAALHPPQADQRVLDRPVQGMAHVQLAGDVRRGQRDRVGLAAGVGPPGEHARGLPAGEERLLVRVRLVARVHPQIVVGRPGSSSRRLRPIFPA